MARITLSFKLRWQCHEDIQVSCLWPQASAGQGTTGDSEGNFRLSPALLGPLQTASPGIFTHAPCLCPRQLPFPTLDLCLACWLLEGRDRVWLIYADTGFSQHWAHKPPCELASWAQLSSRSEAGRVAGRGPNNWSCECWGQVAGASSINVSQLSLSRIHRPCQPWQYWLKRVAGTHPRL